MRVFGIVAVCVGIFIGCRQEQEASRQQSQGHPQPLNGSDEPQSKVDSTYFPDGLDSNALLKSVANRYALARSYRDGGELLLTYKLQGRPIKEPHPFSTAWSQGHQLSARLFKSHIQADGKLLSCYVYDINTANLDQQQLFLSIEKQLPLGQLFEDSIVRHYLGGYADLPLDESDKTQIPRLIPPPISLLTDQLSFGWISQPQASSRLPDQIVEQRPCYVVRSKYDNMTADIWIDQESKLLMQISMPLKIMDRQVLDSGEITDVELTMRFRDPQIDFPVSESDRTMFRVGLKPKATPVRRFISVPDPFPSERIGQLVPKFELLRPNGEKIDHLFFDGKTSVLLWVSSADLDSMMKPLASLMSSSGSNDVVWGLVYSETELDDSNSSSLKPNSELLNVSKQSSIPLYFDPQLQTSNKFQLQMTPAIIVIGPNSKLEFVSSVSKPNWFEEITTVIQKIQRGVDVAGEMRTAYQEFQANYQQQKVTASARPLISRLPGSNAELTGQPRGDQLSVAFDWKPQLVWTKTSLTKPGNLLVNSNRSPSSLLLLDGYRTVVELDFDGNELTRRELELPEQAVVSCLRVASGLTDRDSKSLHYAGFNVQGDKLYLFDEAWQVLASIPPSDFVHDGVRDVIVTSTEQQKPRVMVALANSGGCLEFDCDSKVMKQVFRSRADSIAGLGNEVFFCNSSHWGRLQDEADQNQPTDDLMFQRLIAVESASHDEPGFVGITAVDRDNNWFFCKLGRDGKLSWRQPVGPQLFENEIEPLAGCQFRSGGRELPIVAVADSAHRITLIAGDGSFLGQFAAPAALSGISLLESNGALHLVLSTEQGLVNYRLAKGGVTASPASNPQQP